MVSFDQKKDIDAILFDLETQTNLKFNRLDGHFITVSSASNAFSLQELDEIIVSNYLTSGLDKSKSGTIIIKPEQFGILPGLIEPDVLQTIQALPGVLSIDETVSNINVRGGTHDQNLILYDGIKMYQSGHFFGLISAFNPYLTKNVAVIKNGTSAKYGDGVSSVIDMQLSNETDDPFNAQIGINMISLDGFVVIPLATKTQLQLATRRSISDIINTPTYNQYYKRVFQDSDVSNTETSISDNQTFRFSDISLKLLHDIGTKNKLRFTLLNVFNQLDFEEFDPNNTVTQNTTSQLNQQNRASGLQYQRIWNTKLNTSIHAYYSNYDLKSSDFSAANNQRLIQENEVINNGVKVDGSYSLNSSLSVIGGFQFDEVGISNLEELNSPFLSRDNKRVLRTYSTYAESIFNSKNKNTTVKLGLRHNYFSKFNLINLEPRVYLSQLLFKHFTAELSGELKSQTTSQLIDLQNDFLGIEKRRWVLANNTTIPIIKSKQASLGLTYNKNKLLISAEGYYKQVDGITTRSQGFQNQYQFINVIGNYNVSGIDLLVNKQLDAFSTWLSYSYSTNTYTFEGLNNNEAFANNADIQHVVNFGSTYTLDRLKLALGVNWHSGRPFTKPDTNNPITGNIINYQAPNSSRLDDYLRADFSSTYQFKLGKNNAAVGVSVWNILNKKNTINTYYRIDNDSVNKVENVSLGLTPNASFRLRF